MFQGLFTKLAGYRKVLVTLLVFGVSTLLMLLGNISEAGWVELNKFVIPSFMAANLISKFAGGKEKSE